MNVKQRGFTLIELVVYIGIISLVAIASTSFVWSTINDQSKQESLSEVEYNGMFVLDKIGYNLKRARSVDISNSQFNTQLGKLILSFKDSPTTTFDTYKTSVNFEDKSVTTTKIRVTEIGKDSIDLTSDKINVKRLTFKDLSHSKADVIRVNLELERLNPSDNKYYEASETWKTAYTIKKR